MEDSLFHAISTDKIPSEAKNRTNEIINFILQTNPIRNNIQLIAVKCPKCNNRFAAPLLVKTEGIAEIQARTLYEELSALRTKNYGPFRFIDHFGILNINQEKKTKTELSFIKSLWFYRFIMRFWTFVVVLTLYYILGFEMKIGKRWISLGPILAVIGILLMTFLTLSLGLLDRLREILQGL